MMRSVLLNKRIPLEAVGLTNRFIALRILPLAEYQNGQKTDNILGYSYECVDEIYYDRYTIKVKNGPTPLISNEELQERRAKGEKIIFQFTNPTVYLYYSRQSQNYLDSFSAEAVSFVSE